MRFIRCQPVVLRPAFLERDGRSAVHPIRNQILRSILKYIENRGSTRRVKRKIGVDCSVPESEVVSVLGFTFWLLHFERGETMVWKSQNSRLQTQNVRIDLRVRASN
jgi:hypothetical protein